MYRRGAIRDRTRYPVDLVNYNNSIIRHHAYTVDHVLVYNVFFYNVPKKTTNHEISEYFQAFGNIASVRLLNDRSKGASGNSKQMGFVKFSDVESASAALGKTHHYINERRIWVKAADSWHQPDAQTSASKAVVSWREPYAQPSAATAANCETTTTDASILNLNDDCLDLIFKLLPIKDQINLAGCCKRLKDVYAMYVKYKHKTLDLNLFDCLTLYKTRQFLQWTGSQVEKLHCGTIRTNFNRLVKFIGVYCTSIKSVSIKHHKISKYNLRNLLKNMDMVEELDIYDPLLKDDCILVLKKLRNLKTLSLEGNSYLTGKHIKDLTTVESLSLNGCVQISSSSFRMIWENLKNLKFLDIKSCLRVKLSVIQDIVKNLDKLETIKFTCQGDEDVCIASLPRLKHLYFSGHVPSTIFEELAVHRADQLETLSVEARYINPEKVSSIGKLRNLKKLMCNINYLDKISQLQELELLSIKCCCNFSFKILWDLIQKCPNLSIIYVPNQWKATKVVKLLQLDKIQHRRRPLKILRESYHKTNLHRSII